MNKEEFEKAKKKKAHELSEQFFTKDTKCPNPEIALACEKMADWVYENYIKKQSEDLKTALEALEYYTNNQKSGVYNEMAKQVLAKIRGGE